MDATPPAVLMRKAAHNGSGGCLPSPVAPISPTVLLYTNSRAGGRKDNAVRDPGQQLQQGGVATAGAGVGGVYLPACEGGCGGMLQPRRADSRASGEWDLLRSTRADSDCSTSTGGGYPPNPSPPHMLPFACPPPAAIPSQPCMPLRESSEPFPSSFSQYPASGDAVSVSIMSPPGLPPSVMDNTGLYGGGLELGMGMGMGMGVGMAGIDMEVGVGVRGASVPSLPLIREMHDQDDVTSPVFSSSKCHPLHLYPAYADATSPHLIALNPSVHGCQSPVCRPRPADIVKEMFERKQMSKPGGISEADYGILYRLRQYQLSPSEAIRRLFGPHIPIIPASELPISQDHRREAGGQGVVFCVEQHGQSPHGSRVAVKCYNVLHMMEEEDTLLAALRREVRFLHHLTHTERGRGCANVVRLLGVTAAPSAAPFERDNTYIGVVLEWCEGGSLFDFLHNPRAPVPDASPAAAHPRSPAVTYSLVHGVANACAFLHGRRVAHRDLKSCNVLLMHQFGSKGAKEPATPVVVDFGLADSIPLLPTTSMTPVRSTPAWEDPAMSTGTCDALCDQYAFGKIVHEVIYRHIPHTHKDPALPPSKLAGDIVYGSDASLRAAVGLGETNDTFGYNRSYENIIWRLLIEDCRATGDDRYGRLRFEQIIALIRYAFHTHHLSRTDEWIVDDSRLCGGSGVATVSLVGSHECPGRIRCAPEGRLWVQMNKAFKDNHHTHHTHD